MSKIYVDGFWQLANAQRKLSPSISLFYPSTVFVESRPRGMLEYVMAKAAGELLCAEMNITAKPLHITAARLPRMLTDQTAAVVSLKTANALDELLPLVGKVQSWPRATE